MPEEEVHKVELLGTEICGEAFPPCIRAIRFMGKNAQNVNGLLEICDTSCRLSASFVFTSKEV